MATKARPLTPVQMRRQGAPVNARPQFRDESPKAVQHTNGPKPPEPVSEERAAEWKRELDATQRRKFRQIVSEAIQRKGAQTNEGSTLWRRTEREVIAGLLKDDLSIDDALGDEEPTGAIEYE